MYISYYFRFVPYCLQSKYVDHFWVECAQKKLMKINYKLHTSIPISYLAVSLR